MVINKTGKAIRGRNWYYNSTSFTSSDSPRVLNVNQDLGRNAVDGWLINDGLGDILVEISDNGTDYGQQITVKNGEVLDLGLWDVNKMRLTHSGTDCGYRVVVI